MKINWSKAITGIVAVGLVASTVARAEENPYYSTDVICVAGEAAWAGTTFYYVKKSMEQSRLKDANKKVEGTFRASNQISQEMDELIAKLASEKTHLQELIEKNVNQ